MSYGEIQKTVNSNLGKPLDVLIEEKTGAVNATGGTATAGGIFAKLNKLLTDWTTARAGKIDNIDAAISTRASQASITTLQNTANAINTATTELINGRVVKSVQIGNMVPTLMPQTVSHSAVNISKSIIILNGDAGDSYPVPPYITGRTSTSFTVSNARNASKPPFSWQIIEFY